MALYGDYITKKGKKDGEVTAYEGLLAIRCYINIVSLVKKALRSKKINI